MWTEILYKGNKTHKYCKLHVLLIKEFVRASQNKVLLFGPMFFLVLQSLCLDHSSTAHLEGPPVFLTLSAAE